MVITVGVAEAGGLGLDVEAEPVIAVGVALACGVGVGPPQAVDVATRRARIAVLIRFITNAPCSRLVSLIPLRSLR